MGWPCLASRPAYTGIPSQWRTSGSSTQASVTHPPGRCCRPSASFSRWLSCTAPPNMLHACAGQGFTSSVPDLNGRDREPHVPYSGLGQGCFTCDSTMRLQASTGPGLHAHLLTPSTLPTHPPAGGTELVSFASSPASRRWKSEWVSGPPSRPSTCSTSLQGGHVERCTSARPATAGHEGEGMHGQDWHGAGHG